MLFDGLNFSNNLVVGLSREFINSSIVETIGNTLVADNFVTIAIDVPKKDLTNFLLAIPFAADSIHMKCLTRTCNDVTWITNETV
jgi:hypothetical protein